MQDANTEATKKKQQQNPAIFWYLWWVRPQEGSQEIVSISEQLQSYSDYCNHLFIILTVVDTPKAGVVSPQGTDAGLCQWPREGGVYQWAGVWQRESHEQESIPHQLPGCCCRCAGTRGSQNTTFCSLSANTAGSEHLLLHSPSSHCLQALLWNSRDCPHTLSLICVYLSLQKAQRNLLHTAAKYNKTQAPEEELSQLVPYDWSPISPSTFLPILFIITQAAWSSQSYQLPQIHFQIAIPERAWAPDQAVPARHNPCHYWRLPWNAGVQLARPQARAAETQPQQRSGEGKGLIYSFWHANLPSGCFSHCQAGHFKRKLFSKQGCLFQQQKNLNWKQTNSTPKFTEPLAGYSSAPQTEMFDVWKTDLLIRVIKMWPGKNPLGFKIRKSTPSKCTLYFWYKYKLSLYYSAITSGSVPLIPPHMHFLEE